MMNSQRHQPSRAVSVKNERKFHDTTFDLPSQKKIILSVQISMLIWIYSRSL